MQEEQMLGHTGWEHLTEPLHVVIEVEMEQQEGKRAMETAKNCVMKLLEPVVLRFNAYELTIS